MMTKAASRTEIQGETWAGAVSETVSSWREMFDRRTAGPDVMAGITTAMVALPLNVALALACDLNPAVGLVTGAVAGVFSALFGGARLQVTGPEVALAPLTFIIVSEHGLSGLLTATFLAGLIQIALGVLRVGRFVKAVPTPVIGGFMAAVGLLVFNSQVPRLIGLKGVRLVSDIRDTNMLFSAGIGTVAIGLSVILALVLLPKVHKRIPAPLVAMAVGVALVLFGVTTPTLERIDSIALSIGLPNLGFSGVIALFPTAIALALLASLDSLLCAAGMDARTGGPKVRTDQELVAQGLANMASACVGGMPVAAAIVRSVAAHEAGAKTRLAPLVQSVVLGLVLLVLAPFLPYIPIAALSGILLVVGYRLIDWRMFLRTYAASRVESLIFLATAAAILVTDFVTGVGIGVVLAVLDFARRSARIEVSARPANLPVAAGKSVKAGQADDLLWIIHLEGALFFGSHTDVEQMIGEAEGASQVVVDLSGVSHADMTGAISLSRVVKQMSESGVTVWIQGASKAALPLLDAAGMSDYILPAETVLESVKPSRAEEADKESSRPSLVSVKPRRRPQLTALQPSLE